MRKILLILIFISFFLLINLTFAQTNNSTQIDELIKRLLEILLQNKAGTSTPSSATKEILIPSPLNGGSGSYLSVPEAVKLPEKVKPATPFDKPITPEIIKPILPDEDREDDAVIQINNLKITRIVSSTPEAKGIIFAVRDLGWKCLFYESEESSVSLPCSLSLRRPIIQRELVIKVVDDTILLFRDRKRAKIEDFQAGDKINVYGFMDKDNYGIEALIVRNLSRSSTTKQSSIINKFTGYITSEEKGYCPPCVYQVPPCLMPCRIDYSYFLSLKENNKKYELIPQNNEVRVAIEKYSNSNILVTIVGTLKENKILVDQVYQISPESSICIQVITPAQNPLTGECKEFPTPCDVPEGWKKVEKCPTSVVPEIQQVKEVKVEADDYGFYPSKIEVSKNSKVSLTFVVRQSNVYYGGLDFRSEKFKTEPVKPGNMTKVEFITDKSFVVSSYWPLSDVKKADLSIVVK